MKFLKDSKSTKVRARRSPYKTMKEANDFMLTQMYNQKNYETYSFPNGDLRITKEKLGYFFSAWPLEVLLDYQDNEDELAEKCNNLLWLLDMKAKYPSYPNIYSHLIEYFEDAGDQESWCSVMLEMKEHCPQTPMALYEEMYYNEQCEEKTREQLNTMYGSRVNDLHAIYPSRKSFFVEEIKDILGFCFNNAILDKNFDVAQQYIDKVNEIVGVENHHVTETWRIKLLRAKTPRWKKILFPVLVWSIIIGVIAFILWLIYKAGAWVFLEFGF